MEANTFKDLVDTAKTGPYISFKNKVKDFNYSINLIASLNSWYSVFTKRCSYCEQQISISEEGEFIVYRCSKCNKSHSHYYLHLDEKIVEKDFMNLLRKQ